MTDWFFKFGGIRSRGSEVMGASVPQNLQYT